MAADKLLSRRDGTRFSNLLMYAPLYDDSMYFPRHIFIYSWSSFLSIPLIQNLRLHDYRADDVAEGVVRYFIIAQVCVTGLVRDGRGIDSFCALLQKDEQKELDSSLRAYYSSQKTNSWMAAKVQETLVSLEELSLMFNQDESDVVYKNSRVMENSTDSGSVRSGAPQA